MADIDAAKTTAPGEGSPEGPHAHVASVGLYVGVYAALLVLTASTWGVAHVHLGVFNNVVAVAIAAAKAALVILFFMHARWSPRLVAFAAVAGFFWLALLFGGTFADYLTRAARSLPVH